MNAEELIDRCGACKAKIEGHEDKCPCMIMSAVLNECRRAKRESMQLRKECLGLIGISLVLLCFMIARCIL